MTVQKFITYTPLDIDGNQLDVNHELTLTVSETSGCRPRRSGFP